MLQEADLSMTEAAFGATRPKKGEHYVRFFVEPVQDHAASNKEGRPIFRDTEFIEIRAPGNTSNILVKEVNDKYRNMFAEQYARFKSMGEDNQEVGTPLKAWPVITRAQVEELKFFGVTTVENLAQMSDTNTQNSLGLKRLRDKARAFLAAAEEAAPLEAMQAELSQKDNRIEALEKEVEMLKEAIAELKEDE